MKTDATCTPQAPTLAATNQLTTMDDFEMPFGKYKGKMMTAVPPGYLLHLFDNMEWFRGRPRFWVEKNLGHLRAQVQMHMDDKLRRDAIERTMSNGTANPNNASA